MFAALRLRQLARQGLGHGALDDHALALPIRAERGLALGNRLGHGWRQILASGQINRQRRKGQDFRQPVKQRPVATGKVQRQLRRDHRCHVQRVETHAIDQPVGQRVGGHAGLPLGHMGIGFVQGRARTRTGIGRVDEDALDAAPVKGQQRFQCLQVVALDQQVAAGGVAYLLHGRMRAQHAGGCALGGAKGVFAVEPVQSGHWASLRRRRVRSAV